jgi:hypothetical protein
MVKDKEPIFEGAKPQDVDYSKRGATPQQATVVRRPDNNDPTKKRPAEDE